MRLNAMLVDDERLALDKMERLLRKQSYPDLFFDHIESCDHPLAAIDIAKHASFHVAFLDIEMPEMNGFVLAERLLQLQPHIHIVFLTAYQEYAVKAFELNALDYLLKPVHPQRLHSTLQRIHRFLFLQAKAEASTSTLCCLQSLHYSDTHGNIQHFPWKTLKAQELLAYLIYYREKTVHKQALMDLLWPHVDNQRATAQLHTAIYQIRKMIKMAGLDLEIKYKDEGYRVVWGSLKLDVEEWEHSVKEAPPIALDTLKLHLTIMEAYTGDLFEEHRFSWSEYERDRIRMIWLKHVDAIARYYLSQFQYTEAILLYRKIIEKFPLREEGYFMLMNIHAILQQPSEVRKQYQLLKNMCQKEYDALPSEGVVEWYENWAKNMSTK